MVGPRARDRGGTRCDGLGLENVDFDELLSLIDPGNDASVAVATKLGERHRTRGELRGRPVEIYAITREEWMALPRGGT